MSIQPISKITINNKPALKPYDFIQMSGYGALGFGGLCLLQGVRHKKSHKILGFLAFVLASMHVGLIEYLAVKNKNSKLNHIV